MAFLDPATWQDRVFTGAWTPGGDGVREVREPATGAVLGSVGAAGPADVDATVERAVAAQKEWAATPHTERAAVLLRAAALFAEHAGEISDWLVRESGSVRLKAGIEIDGSAGECTQAAALASAPYGELLPAAGRVSLERRVPAGVVAVVSPFNFPLLLSMRSVAPALALGNAVVVKPDPRTAVCGGVVIARVLEAAGLPAGVLQVLPGGAGAGAALVEHPRVPVLSFTGSTRAGRAIGAKAGELLKRAHLELGGNSALVVCADADLEAAASCGAFGSFLHQGQICMATGRHLVHRSLYDRYVELLGKKVEQLPVGDPFTGEVALGPIIDDGQLAKVADLVERSVAAGARLVQGGTADGPFFRPTVLADCHPGVPAYAEEVFGPVACVRPFDTLDEAAEMASDTEYGLSLGVITADPAAGLALADRIPTGLVHVNDQTVNDDPSAPFGGVGASGVGRVGGARANVEAFTETQWVTVRAESARYPF
ncbi:putative benzaldehyde dehydrogenase oxidoreductase protein [Pseudonocardia sp. Ae168_Ps1]|uniref:aldehyde dehydrogenase family protein n=1 Tax=unclassified Pseudonocardia TaxID=2619320 RepID=UPI00094B075C|nr:MULTISPECIES: aldehyde dehydrogenase family protein [unclassified Pseudonocardia]OLL72323.1 putative benzaldehyde dehydrogenase oxidoreductase protein [Pseudonocardia sp. Ae150A_Ps1]OLL78294.1 putative benzaldehyde dehydrogenase oxidoreductase protein [Pseudonocardia sp. Ae168_Ps1]OLL87579.1 putative benzaldehyde dehydrogenase oxidoreductase protein [Pseudonocardia sp. Ae263_Ps1]OLL92390.1 putative benzaldehyde dehydrogenase oxidoreductase protein [Pseudonocardia sp. Ae356_Ps1]